MSDLTCWMYISTATIPRAHAAQVIDAIVAISRGRNAALEVTGALIFSGDMFAQIIEGPAEAIAELRASITRDVRHREILTMADGEQNRRQFADWSLAYSGTALFVARELDRIRAARASEPYNSDRDLRRLLGELAL
ncbi:MAG: BLUF domain-containing protein [Sphingopyxis sp.]|nr:BLUF domain-containing protein [Sphingopyxis sp.]